MTEEHNKELKRRLTECNGGSLNYGSTKYLTGYTHSGNKANGRNIDLFQDEVATDVFLTNIGEKDYYKHNSSNKSVINNIFDYRM